MDKMKVATIIFTALGIVINFLYVNWILGLIGIGVGIWMITTLVSDKKQTAAGVCGILFTGIIAGILYLCWNPETAKGD